MSWTRDTLQQIKARVEGDAVADLGIATPVLRRSLVKVFSRMVAGGSHLMMGSVENLARQIFASTSDDERFARHAAEWGQPRHAASYSVIVVNLTGTVGSAQSPGSVINAAGGLQYETLASVTIAASGTATVTARAVLPGPAHNVATGTALTVASPGSGVSSSATSGDVLVSGGDEETSDAWRQRLADYQSGDPTGGSESDYIRWSKSVPGVTRSWVYRGSAAGGDGRVIVRFVRDGDAEIIPSTAEVAEVQRKFDFERPASVFYCYALAPEAKPIAYTIVINPQVDSPGLRSAIELSIRDLHWRKGAPGNPPLEQGRIYLDEINAAISKHTINYVMPSPYSDFIPALGQMATVGAFNWGD